MLFYVEDLKVARTLAWAARCRFWMDTNPVLAGGT